PVLSQGDTVDEHGRISRLYAWSERPSYETCYLTDATWDLGDLKGNVDIDSLPIEKATFATNPSGEVLDHLDLMADFIPVIHQPNTVPPAEEHWGQSSLAKALQVFDELQGTDTDSSRASATTGSPIFYLSGKNTSGRQYLAVGPGTVLEGGEGGRMDTVNTAPQLAELRNHTHDLKERASNVVRLPAVSLGTMDPSKVPSGYALQLSLGPLDSLIAGMRLARAHKDSLLLKFVTRLHLAGQHPDWMGVPVLPVVLVRGPYTPTDKAAVLAQVTTALEAGAMSLETAVRMLQEAGYPIDDIDQEIQQIDARSFEKARDLADALGSPDEVAKFLHRQAPAISPAPDPELPPAPGDSPRTDPVNTETAGQGDE
ncbi:hypothetical protein, partial [Streptomyces sp. NPDC060243]|uniref:hypothetical protein n=1 Tax=Streptomyces sp. NPDC060243 TaxID=3347081 RepID=UPI00365F6CA9